MKILWMVVLIAAALQDFKERQVSVILVLFGAVAGGLGLFLMGENQFGGVTETWTDMEQADWMVKYLEMQAVRIGKAAGIGMILLILAKVTGGAMGYGDGLFFLMSACYWEWKYLLVLFLGALGVSSAWGMALLMKRQWSRGGNHVDQSKETIPFLTCCLVPGAFLVWNGLR